MPWQADFHACGDDWWPVPRPNQVIRAGAYAEWKLPGVTSQLDMVNKWHTLGFVVRQGADLVEVDRCDLANAVVNLVTPALTFTDIAQGPMGTSRTVSPRRRVRGHLARGGLPGGHQRSDRSEPHGRLRRPAPRRALGRQRVLAARVEVSYTAPNDTHSVLDSITVTCVETSQTWVIPIAANAVPRKVAAVALVLDKSGSMNEDRGDGLGTKNQSLRAGGPGVRRRHARRRQRVARGVQPGRRAARTAHRARRPDRSGRPRTAWRSPPPSPGQGSTRAERPRSATASTRDA